MLPKMFDKERHPHPYQQFGSFALAATPAIALRAEFSSDQQSLMRTVELPPNTNIDAILQVHRRKMLRRAANRRSAQLSRARKKAHLEDLKAENARLQRLVDVLDSQPELVFCMTGAGRITYVSERTINFVKISFGGEDSDEDPTHISQILAKESVDSVLETITKLQTLSLSPASTENDLNMLFSVKEVYFHDASGNLVVGYLRCSRVHRRTSLQEIQTTADSTNNNSTNNNNNITQQATTSTLPPAKKAKTKNTTSTKNSNIIATTSTGDDWNYSNFKLLTDCCADISMKNDIEGMDDEEVSKNNNTNNNTTEISTSITSTSSNSNNSNNSNGENNSSQENINITNNTYDADNEFVCVIRTSNNYFVPHQTERDMLMFTVLSPANVAAHNLEMRSLGMGNELHARRGSSGSNNSSTNHQSTLTSSSNTSSNNQNNSNSNNRNAGMNTGTSSETASEEEN